MKKHVFLTIAPLLLMLLSFTNAIAGEGKVVTIRIYETSNGGNIQPKIQIIEEGKSRQIELEKFAFKTPDQNKNLEKINNLLEDYIKSGYKIETSNSVELVTQFIVTTYILTK